MYAVSQKVPNFLTEDYEEQLVFCLNEEDEEDNPPQSDSGKDFEIPFHTGLLLDMVVILELVVPQ